MVCDRCEDIHKAQKDGKTNQKCECDCHITYSTGTEPICTCQTSITGTTTGQFCPVHGSTFFLSTAGNSTFDPSAGSTINI